MAKRTANPARTLFLTASRDMSYERIAREQETIETMVRLYCRAMHTGSSQLCSECDMLLNYARQRLSHCRFGVAKPVCARCPVHCYRQDMRRQVVTVMRFAGPRMLFFHPWLVLLHWLDSVKRSARDTQKNQTIPGNVWPFCVNYFLRLSSEGCGI